MRQDGGAVPEVAGMALSCQESDESEESDGEPTSTNGAEPSVGEELRPHTGRVLLKLSGEVFGGGSVGVDPTSSPRSPGRSPRSSRSGVQVAVVIGGGNYFRGAELSAAWHGPRPRRLHGHARHGHELPRAAGLPGEAGRRDPGADRDRDGSGRRAVHPAARRSGTWRRAGSSSSAPVSVRRTSPPTPPPPSARWRSVPRSC